MAAGYRYVGPLPLAEIRSDPSQRFHVRQPQDVREWVRQTRQARDAQNIVIATFIIDLEGQLWIADRHSEHVQCACGERVLSAGEISFCLGRNEVTVVGVTNQSSGYCPEPQSWPSVAVALENIGLASPGGFTTEFVFRRCPACDTINIVKDGWFECAVCGNALPQIWNCSPTD